MNFRRFVCVNCRFQIRKSPPSSTSRDFWTALCVQTTTKFRDRIRSRMHNNLILKPPFIHLQISLIHQMSLDFKCDYRRWPLFALEHDIFVLKTIPMLDTLTRTLLQGITREIFVLKHDSLMKKVCFFCKPFLL